MTAAARFAPLSTHVLDTVRGEPAPGVPVRLERPAPGGGWHPVAEGETGDDGRLRDWAPATAWGTGGFRLLFLVEAYLAARCDQPAFVPEIPVFFPEIAVAFRVTEPRRHHHVPLLLSPYGYTTYRGS